MVPGEAFQVTDLLEVPWTAAVKESVPLTTEADDVGEIVTEMPEFDVLLEAGDELPTLPAHPDVQGLVATMMRRNKSAVTRFGDKEFISIKRSLFLKLFISNAIRKTRAAWEVGLDQLNPSSRGTGEQLAVRTD
jgi:hypothetical protein